MNTPDRIENEGLSEKELEDFREREEIRLIKFFGQVFYSLLREYPDRINSGRYNSEELRNLIFDTAYGHMITVDSFVAEKVRKIINDNFYSPAMKHGERDFVYFCADACKAIQQADHGILFVGNMAVIEQRYRNW